MSKAKNWSFTEYDLTNLIEDEELKVDEEQIRFLVCQLEEGEETHMRHIQGYVQFKDRKTLNTAKNAMRSKKIHMEIARGSPEQNIGYCTKKETRIAGPWQYGTVMRQGQRTDLETIATRIVSGQKLSDLALTNPEYIVKYPRGLMVLQEMTLRKDAKKIRRLDMEVSVIWGRPGCGKTRYVYDTEGMENVYSLHISENGRLWYDGYEGENTLLIDEYYGRIKYSDLLQILDIYPLRLEVKGGTTWANWHKVYITSNEHPNKWYPNVIDKKALYRRIKHIKHIENPVDTTDEAQSETDVTGNTGAVTSYLITSLTCENSSDEKSPYFPAQ